MVEITKKSGGGGTKALGCIGLIVVGIIGLGALGSQVEDKAKTDGASAADASTTTTDDTATADASSAKDAPPASDWSYSQQKDDLRGATDYYAEVTSENEVNFDFPYSGGSRLSMTVRNSKAYGDDVIFRISDGQFICGIYDCKGMISFDGKPESLTLVPPEDHDSKTLFAKYAGGITKKLKAADKVVVELQFYQEGNRQFTFNSSGLEWKH